jgi:hypothetical protein
VVSSEWRTWPDDLDDGPDTGVAAEVKGYWLEVMPTGRLGWSWEWSLWWVATGAQELCVEGLASSRRAGQDRAWAALEDALADPDAANLR